MKVKKYIAPSMPEAMKAIRAELGSEAVILNSKMIQTGGIFGFFKKKNIEVIAAVDPAAKTAQVPVIKEKQKNVPVKPEQSGRADSPFNKVYTGKGSDPEAKAPPELAREINELRSLISSVRFGGSDNAVSYPEPVLNAQKLMSGQGISTEIQKDILSVLVSNWYTGGATADDQEVFAWLKAELMKRISSLQFGGITFTKKYVNVVGPTGVGKTTTLAKMAADCILAHNKKVAFITTDTYRIAAIEQLKTYAKILNVPIEVCYNFDDFQKAASQFADYDTVLIDTAGRNFRNRQYVEDLKAVVDFEKEIETFLVLSLTSKQEDMEEIYKQFSLIHIDKLIFTKTDETSSYGAMINMIDKHSTGIAFLTYGQNVPDDMKHATAEVIVNTVLGVERHE
ncbi:flagellar biosynthesis protein FlhF [Bacillus canaveralius]|uniref:Flagellar biosynthesis protein FlhF n=1 Tax=Bacillus canaveralius TaxID=1403243 RepID=A0A2N5GP56_9BACI|nr:MULTISPECIES: flagellar biosynthesis protein FlhF [Bacillus]PLR84229.1 flagellar biosynthesis protein FlhF [Bacillus canaveralius]PLR87452.1 flagellar biosynthesis protein FlhF [Bacillus sp. V33-4]PLR89407.1 flagellar biosynthesis protein FlhF [Bacillus canaveralius]